MNELIGPLLLAAIFSAGDVLHGRATAPGPASEQAQAAAARASPYVSVEASGELRRGERLPARYQSHEHVIDDWRALRLAPPPRGHQWVRADASYALVAIATGRVEQLVLAR